LYILVELGCFVFLFIYMPTNYCTHTSDKKFASTCKSLSKTLHKIQAINRWHVICGDFNPNLNDPSLPLTQIFLSSLLLSVSVLPKCKPFSCVHNSGPTSNLDFVLSDHQDFSLPLLSLQMIYYPATIYTSSSTFTCSHCKIKQDPVGLQKYHWITLIYRPFSTRSILCW
jgi:hypothetical protein